MVSQAQILQSADLIKEVAKQLKLYELKEFDPDAYRLLPDPLVLLHLKQDPMDLAPEERVIKTFREKLQVYPVEGSRIIAIEFSSKDPSLPPAFRTAWRMSICPCRAGQSSIPTRSDALA